MATSGRMRARSFAQMTRWRSTGVSSRLSSVPLARSWRMLSAAHRPGRNSPSTAPQPSPRATTIRPISAREPP